MSSRYRRIFNVYVIGVISYSCLLAPTYGGPTADSALPSSCPLPKELALYQSRSTPPAAGETTYGLQLNLPQDLANYVFGRAKTEGEAYLIDVALKKLCSSDGGNYFPNTCALRTSADPSTIPTSKMFSAMQVDLKSLPACVIFKKQYPTSYDPAKIVKTDPALLGYGMDTVVSMFVAANPKDTAAYTTLVTGIFSSLGAPIPNGAALQNLISQIQSSVSQVKDASTSTGYADAIGAAIFVTIIANNPTSTGPLGRFVTQILNAYYDIRQKQYASAVSDVGGILHVPCKTSDPADWCVVIAKVAQIAEASNDTQATALMNSLFAGATSTAQLGSVNLLSLAGMAGIQGGRERLASPINGSSSTYGAFLPIGLDANFKTRHSFCSSVGGFVSVIDLGAWISYSNPQGSSAGTTSGTAKVSGTSAISPGIYGVCTLENSPFRIGFGVSRTPALRSVDLTGGTTTDSTSTRAIFFFAIDVPMLDIHKW